MNRFSVPYVQQEVNLQISLLGWCFPQKSLIWEFLLLLTGQEADHITEIAIQGHGQGAITGGQDSE